MPIPRPHRLLRCCAWRQRMTGDMELNAGRIREGEATLAAVAGEILVLVKAVARGAAPVSEQLGHQEFGLPYKRFNAAGPGCLPG